MKILNSLLKRKPKTVRQYLSYAVNNPKMNFQMDIIRDNLVEIQITRQRLLKRLGVSIESPEGFSISAAFHNKINDKDYERFKTSNIFEKSIHYEKYDELYFFLCENDLHEVLNLLRNIQVKVYGYNDNTIYGYKFFKIPR